MRDIWDAIKFIIVVPINIIIFLLASALEWILKRVFNYTPKWVHVSEDHWRDIYCYETGNDENGKSYIEISTANGGEENETTYPIAKDFIIKVFSPYHVQVKIESKDKSIEIYNQLLSKHYSEQIFFDKDYGIIYIFCDDIKPIFEILAIQSEYFYYFDVCAFESQPQVNSYQDAEKLMEDKSGLLFIQCEKQHDRIMLYFDDKMFSESDLLKSFRECCEQHDRRFMTSEEMVALYP